MNNLQLIEKALYYIDEHLCEELTYERLAQMFGYSRSEERRVGKGGGCRGWRGG